MRLFQRVGDILAANLNDLIDRFEDPEVLLRQAIREMEASIEAATASTARAIAHERLLFRERSEHEAQARLWRSRAEHAIESEDEGLARRALARKHEHEALAAALEQEGESAHRATEDLRRQVEAMRAKHAEARRKLTTLSARLRTASAARDLGGAASSSSKGFARYARLRESVDRAEAEAEVLSEWLAAGDSEWDDAESQRKLDSELGEIKDSLKRRAGTKAP